MRAEQHPRTYDAYDRFPDYGAIAAALIENALDAGASMIRVSIGATLTVADNGRGMGRGRWARLCADQPLTVAPFAVERYGVRGQSLQLLRLVARLSYERADGWSTLTVGPLRLPVGEPLEADADRHAIRETARRYAMARPDVALEVSAPRSRLAVSAAALPERLGQALSSLAKAQLYPVSGESAETGVSVAGVISGPDESRSDLDGLFLAINGRPWPLRFTSRLAADLLACYGRALPEGRYPAGVLLIRVPARLMRHWSWPTPRLNDVALVSRVVASAVRETVRPLLPPPPSPRLRLPPAPLPAGAALPPLRLVGTARGYVLAEGPNDLYLLDPGAIGADSLPVGDAELRSMARALEEIGRPAVRATVPLRGVRRFDVDDLIDEMVGQEHGYGH
jgi:hypothetical protein